jgi:hypothetical protein
MRAPFVAVSVSATASAIEYQSFRSSCATCAFRGAETRAKRLIRRKTSYVPISVLSASPVHQHLEHGWLQGPDLPRRPHLHRGPRRGRSPPDYEEPQARRHPVCPAFLRKRWKVPWDPGPARRRADLAQLQQSCGNQRSPLFRTAIGSIRRGIRALRSCRF